MGKVAKRLMVRLLSGGDEDGLRAIDRGVVLRGASRSMSRICSYYATVSELLEAIRIVTERSAIT